MLRFLGELDMQWPPVNLTSQIDLSMICWEVSPITPRGRIIIITPSIHFRTVRLEVLSSIVDTFGQSPEVRTTAGVFSTERRWDLSRTLRCRYRMDEPDNL